MGVTRCYATVGEMEFLVEVVEEAGRLRVAVGGDSLGGVELVSSGEHRITAMVDGQPWEALVEIARDHALVAHRGLTFQVSLMDERLRQLAQVVRAGHAGAREWTLVAPMPGLVVAVNVSVGDSVSKGVSLVVLQAMKMENDLLAQQKGTVKDVRVSAGQTVELGQPLMVME